MKRIVYWKNIDLQIPGFGVPVEFKLVPVTTVEQTHAFFSKIVEQIKASGFSYRIYEDTCIEASEFDAPMGMERD